jgi:hypothetical protein
MNICQKNCGTMVNLLHQQSHRYTMYVNGLVPTYSLQSCRRVILLYLLLHYRKILHLINDITIILARDDK